MIRVTALMLYPVKSLRGYAVPEAEVDELGLVGDRRFLVVSPDGKFLTQRSHPAMARVEARLSGGTLTLSTEGQGPVAVPTTHEPEAPLLSVSIWSNEGLLAEDCGHEVASWLTAALGTDARLARIGPAFSRPLRPEKARPGESLTYWRY